MNKFGRICITTGVAVGIIFGATPSATAKATEEGYGKCKKFNKDRTVCYSFRVKWVNKKVAIIKNLKLTHWCGTANTKISFQAVTDRGQTKWKVFSSYNKKNNKKKCKNDRSYETTYKGAVNFESTQIRDIRVQINYFASDFDRTWSKLPVLRNPELSR
jgi:hypothetical protein